MSGNLDSVSICSLPQGIAFDIANPILDSIADGVFTVDRNRIITSFNHAAEQITGYRREQAIGKPCSEVLKASICKNRCALEHTLQTGQQLINLPVQIESCKGQRIPISISTAVLFDQQGHRIGGVETFRDLSAISELRKQIQDRYGIEDIVGRHPKLIDILDLLPDISSSDATVLIQGGSGTGKGLLAKAIHNLSHRKEKPFVKVNCAALPESLLESELFGYVKGAFTDAKSDKPGRIALAEGGTLFLDEIGEVAPMVQVKLLRVVQDREYEPLGAVKTQNADVRVLAATNRDLRQAMREGVFREDLYYRLNIIELALPTLTERREDIPLLVDRFLYKMGSKMAKYVTSISEEAMELLLQHDYPGNVRELENAIEHAMVLCQGSTIERKHLPLTLRNTVTSKHMLPEDFLQAAEADTIRTMLKRHDGNRIATAKALGLHRTTLWRKMQRYGID